MQDNVETYFILVENTYLHNDVTYHISSIDKPFFEGTQIAERTGPPLFLAEASLVLFAKKKIKLTK